MQRLYVSLGVPKIVIRTVLSGYSLGVCLDRVKFTRVITYLIITNLVEISSRNPHKHPCAHSVYFVIMPINLGINYYVLIQI